MRMLHDNSVASLRHAVHQLENCLFDIFEYMQRNALKLNKVIKI